MNFCPTSRGGGATSGSAKHPGCLYTLIRGYGAGCGRCCKRSGSTFEDGGRSCSDAGWVASGRRKPPAATSGRGGSAKTLRSAKSCPRPSLMRSACLDSPPGLSLTRRTAVYGSVRTVVWQGGAGNRSPLCRSREGPTSTLRPPGYWSPRRRRRRRWHGCWPYSCRLRYPRRPPESPGHSSQ